MSNELIKGINSLIDLSLSRIWTATPCVIRRVNYKDDSITVDVQPIINKVDGSGNTYNRPVILDVPLQMPGSASSLINIPVSKGDTVLCVFCKSDITSFIYGDGEITDPKTLREMSINDAIAIPGVFPNKAHPNKNRTLPHDASSLSITNNIGTALENTVSLLSNGSIEMKSPTQIDIDAPIVTINGIVFNTHTHNVTSAPGVSAAPNP